MPESYFENAEITVTSDEKMKTKKVLRTKPYSGPVTLTYSKVTPAKQLSTKNETATKGAFSTPIKYTAPAVEKTEEFYKLRVMCAYKKVNKLLLETTIWPKETSITINDKNGKGMPGCPFIVRQEGIDDQTLNTDDKGKCTATLMARKPYTIHMADAYTVLEDKQATTGQFRDHVLKVETAITAKFVTPNVDEDPYVEDADNSPAKKQWVNMKSANPDHAATGGCDAKGSVIVFTVSADPPEKGLKDDKVYFEVTFGRESKRTTPKPEVTTGIAVLGKKVADKVTKGYVVLDKDGGTGNFEVCLGIAGGDTCTVKIGGTDEVKDAKLKLINWRKMYAQITKTASLTSPNLAPAIGCLKKMFIDFEESTADAVTVDASGAPAGSVVDGNALIRTGMPTDSLVVGDHNVAWFKTKLKPRFASEGLPCAHLIYCNEQLDGANPIHDSSTVVLGKKTGQTQGTVAFPGGASVPGLSIPGTAGAGNGIFFAKDLKDGTDAVKLCKWEEVGGTGTGDITSADYKINHPTDGNTLFIRLPTAAKDLSDAGKDIKVSYQVAFAKGWFNGWCTRVGRHLVIKVGRPANDICGTIVHEVGHAISQSAKDTGTYPGITPVPHSRFYTDNRGHQGPHCADGIDEATYNNSSARMDTAHASSKCTCIMYGAGADLRNQTMAFCAKCEPFVKAAPISSVST